MKRADLVRHPTGYPTYCLHKAASRAKTGPPLLEFSFVTGGARKKGGQVKHPPRDPDRDSIVYGRPDRLKVFVSSEMRRRSLDAERRAAGEAVDEHPDAEVWMWERSAHAGPYCSLEVCRGEAATSDFLILIVATTLTHATEAEWRAAKAAGASCAIFVKEGVRRSTRLRAFLRAERDISIYVTYRDATALKRRIGEALRQSHTSAIRKGVLIRRRAAAIGATGPIHLLEAGLESAEHRLWTGSAMVAAELVAELENLFGDRAEGREDLDLLSGHVHAVLGDRQRTAKAYERILADPGHTPIGAAIAQQNLGLEALKARDLVRARHLMADAFRRHFEARNWFGVLQMLLNFGTLEAAEGNPTDAGDFVALAEQLMAELRERLPHQEVSVRALRGHIAALEGRPSDALRLYRQAWLKSRALGNREMSCVCGQNIGSAYADLNRPGMAAKWYMRALSVAEETGNLWRQKELQQIVGTLSHKMGRHLRALEHFEAARALAARTEDQYLVATLTADIGAILAFTHDARAATELNYAAKLLEKVGDREWLYRVELNRGALERSAGDRQRAAVHLRQAVECAGSDDARREGHERLAFLFLDRPTDEAAAVEQFLLAAGHLQSADKAWLLGRFATYLSKAECLSAAITMFDLAIGVGESARDEEVLFHLRNDQSLVIATLGDLARAKRVFEEGVKWARSAGKQSLEIQALHNLGETQRRMGDLVGSRISLARAAEMAETLSDSDSWRSALALLAITALAESSVDEAEQLATRVRDAARNALDRSNESSAIGTLAGVAFARGTYATAALLYRTASRLNREDPDRHCEDLMGFLEASAAADNWRLTLRATRLLVDHAREKRLQYEPWRPLLRAARQYLDRGNSKRAAVLAAFALVSAQETKLPPEQLAANGEEENGITPELARIIRVLLTLAFFVELSPQDSACDVWRFLVQQIGGNSAQTRDAFEYLISIARQAAQESSANEEMPSA